MKTYAPVTTNGITGMPAIGAHECLEIYFNGTNYIGLEASDLLTAPALPASITNAPKQSIKNVTATPFIFSQYFCALHSFDTPLETCNFGTWRSHNSDTDWCYIEQTAKGSFNSAVVAKLDACVAKHIAQGRRIVITLANTPAWASNNPTGPGAFGPGTSNPPSSLANLTDYVNAMLARYGSQIYAFEGWNEPNTPDLWYGTLAQLISHQQTIWNAVQAWNTANSGSVKVCCPAFTVRSGLSGSSLTLDGYLAAGGGAYCDIIGYHNYGGSTRDQLYVDQDILTDVKTIVAARGMTAKKLWMTEAGESNTERADWKHFARHLLYAAALGFEQFAWFHYDLQGIGNMKVKDAAPAWNQAVATLSGKTIGWVNRSNTFQLGALIDGTPTLI